MGKKCKSESSEYHVWEGMKQRCLNNKNPRFPDWGGRGILICDRWINSFDAFYEDMGPRPSLSHELDRFPDKNGNYEPSNCRWATRQEQCLNRRSNLIIEYNGMSMPLKWWTDKLGLSYSKIFQRIAKLKWPIEKAFEIY